MDKSPGQKYFDRIQARMTPWQRFKVKYSVKWSLFKLDLCQAGPFLALNNVGEEFLYAGRPWLAKFLFPHTNILHPSQPIPQE